MNTKILMILFMSLVLTTTSYAQKENKKDKNSTAVEATKAVTPPIADEAPVITENCLMNISLFNESAKNKQYADALRPWQLAYAECPGANKAIYSKGREILQWQLGQAKDEATYQTDFNELMKMYDNRIKYFGDDDRYPTPWILGLKGLDYISFSKTDLLKKPAYGWLEQSIDGLAVNSELEVLRQFIGLSTAIYKADKSHGEKYIADYLKVNDILEQKSKDEDSVRAKIALQIKQNLEYVFAQSGAADCKTLDGIYQTKIAKNSNNIEYLNTVMNFYKLVQCTESEVYFAASVAAYKVQPTSGSANGCAEMSYKKGDFVKAIAFYEDATKLSTDKMGKADYQYKIAQIYYSELNNFQKSREYARNSLEYDPNNGSPYLLIGIMYAKSKGIFDDPVLAKTVYWAAVDKFVKAKQVDSSAKNIEDADKLIRTYSSYYPSKDDIFFQPNLETGKTFYVGGWIGENTVCR